MHDALRNSLHGPVRADVPTRHPLPQLYRYPHYFNNKKIDISALEEKSRPAREQNHFWHKCWNKLAAWTLSKYACILSSVVCVVCGVFIV